MEARERFGGGRKPALQEERKYRASTNKVQTKVGRIQAAVETEDKKPATRGLLRPFDLHGRWS